MRSFINEITSMDAGQLLAHGALLALLGVCAWAFVKLIQSAIDLYTALDENRQQNQENK